MYSTYLLLSAAHWLLLYKSVKILRGRRSGGNRCPCPGSVLIQTTIFFLILTSCFGFSKLHCRRCMTITFCLLISTVTVKEPSLHSALYLANSHLNVTIKTVNLNCHVIGRKQGGSSCGLNENYNNKNSWFHFDFKPIFLLQEGTWLWTDGSKFNYRIFNGGQPDNTGGVEKCLEMNFEGK